MNRRQFLAASAAGTAGLLASSTAAFVGRNLGVGVARAESASAVPPRDEGVRGRVAAVDGASVSIDVEAADDVGTVRLLAARRGYPGGDVIAEEYSDPVRPASSGETETVDLEVPPEESYGSGRWIYEVFVLRNGRRPAFLCESAPYRWRRRPSYGATRGERVTEGHPDASGPAFDRELVGNDYRLRYRWRDSDGRRWRLEYPLRRSVHEAAVARRRGYVRTFEESKSNPYAADLAAAVATDARLVSRGESGGDTDSDGDGETDASSDREADSDSGGETDGDSDDAAASTLAPGERFDGLVRFVQDLPYARDAETTGRYDYNRTVEETLVAGIGDCKDKTHLLAGLLARPPLSCETALLFQPAHVLLGVAADDVPARFADRETVELGAREYLPVDGSLRFPIGAYPDMPITAAYGDGTWIHHDPDAIVGGLERNLGDWVAQNDLG